MSIQDYMIDEAKGPPGKISGVGVPLGAIAVTPLSTPAFSIEVVAPSHSSQPNEGLTALWRVCVHHPPSPYAVKNRHDPQFLRAPFTSAGGTGASAGRSCRGEASACTPTPASPSL